MARVSIILIWLLVLVLSGTTVSFAQEDSRQDGYEILTNADLVTLSENVGIEYSAGVRITINDESLYVATNIPGIEFFGAYPENLEDFAEQVGIEFEDGDVVEILYNKSGDTEEELEPFVQHPYNSEVIMLEPARELSNLSVYTVYVSEQGIQNHDRTGSYQCLSAGYICVTEEGLSTNFSITYDSLDLHFSGLISLILCEGDIELLSRYEKYTMEVDQAYRERPVTEDEFESYLRIVDVERDIELD